MLWSKYEKRTKEGEVIELMEWTCVVRSLIYVSPNLLLYALVEFALILSQALFPISLVLCIGLTNKIWSVIQDLFSVDPMRTIRVILEQPVRLLLQLCIMRCFALLISLVRTRYLNHIYTKTLSSTMLFSAHPRFLSQINSTRPHCVHSIGSIWIVCLDGQRKLPKLCFRVLKNCPLNSDQPASVLVLNSRSP